MKKFLSLILVMFLSGIFLTACKKDKNDEPAEANITFRMEHHVSGQDVDFSQIIYTNDFGNTYSVETLKYFISDIRLMREDGGEVYFDLEHYVDGRVDSTLTLNPSQKVKSGKFTSVSFIFGLSAEKNVNGAFPNPPENNMEWPLPLGGGYHYMKLEGKIDSSGVINNFQAHTGPTGGNANFIEVTLPASSFTVNGSDIELTIRMDINQWWQDPHNFDLNMMTMVMGNQEIQQKLKENGGSVFSFGPVASR